MIAYWLQLQLLFSICSLQMYKLGWDYPLHLGVTEAGEGEDGRMKSAIGIGALLADGLGDTVRVSLTEDPEYEIAPCSTLISISEQLLQDESLFEKIPNWEETSRNFMEFTKRRGDLPAQLPDDPADVRGFLHRDGSVLATIYPKDWADADKMYRSLGCKMSMGLPFRDIATADTLYLPEVPAVDDKAARKTFKRVQDVGVGVMAPIAELQAKPFPNSIALVALEDMATNGLPALPEGALRYAVKLTGLEPADMYTKLQIICGETDKMVMALLEVPRGTSRVHASRRAFQLLDDISSTLPVIHSVAFEAGQIADKDELIIRAGSEAGALLVDGLGDGTMLSSTDYPLNLLVTTGFNMLQGSRMRSTKTEFVSCPSCGRTLFDLQEVTEQIRQKTGHLPGVAIAVMGCIVNGPGEMADADFGYVGGAPGKVDLYVGREVVQRGIPNAEACDALVQLIKDNGRWQEPSSEEPAVGSDGAKELTNA